MRFVHVIFFVVVVSLCIVNTSSSNNRSCSLDSDEIDIFLDELESKIPYLLKEAELLVKLMNSDKYFPLLKEDIVKYCGKDRKKHKPENSFLLKAFNAVELNPNKLLISVDKSVTNVFVYQLTSPELHQRILWFGCKKGPLRNILDEVSKQQMERSADAINSIVEILTPVYNLRNEKFSDKFLEEMNFGTGSRGYHISFPESVYNLFYKSGKGSFNTNHIISGSLSSNRIEDLKSAVNQNSIPGTYFEALKNYIEFIDITRQWADPLPKNFKYYARLIDDISVEAAQSKDLFSDLNDENNLDSGVNESQEGEDISFDDLKLPD